MLHLVRSCLASLLLLFSAACATAQTYPAQTIRIIVPAAAGGPLDIVARTIGDRLGARLGQPVVIEARPGAGGNIGATFVSKSAPDGYNLLLALGNTLTVNPSLYTGLQFDLRPISIVTSATQLLVIHPSVPASNVAEFVAWAKQNQPIAYGHSGNGSPAHLVMEYFRLRAGFTTTPVPYGGSAPLVNDLLTGQFKVAFGATVGLVPHVDARALKALAISSDRRSEVIPNVPTVAESGFPGFRLENDFVLLAQGQTPDKIIAILESAVQDVLKGPELRASFAKQDISVVASTSEEARKRIEADKSLWVDVISQTGMRVN